MSVYMTWLKLTIIIIAADGEHNRRWDLLQASLQNEKYITLILWRSCGTHAVDVLRYRLLLKLTEKNVIS